jgi:nucleoside-diphosphate-sugar epimerase
MPDTKSKSNATLVIGAGELGMSMLHALNAQRTARDGSVSVLLRPTGSARVSTAQQCTLDALRDMGVEVVNADLAADTDEALAAIFSRYATVICCTGFVAGPGTQRKITSAVLKAGVDRYVPWQFGVDYDVVGRGSGQEVFDEQSDVRDMLRAQSRTHWVIVSTGMFTSFLFEPAFGVVDLQNARVHALGSWDHRLTVTTPEDIGRLTIAILKHEPRVDDRVVFVAGDTVTYRELADKVEQHLGKPVERVLWTMETLEAELARHPGDGMRKYHLAFARPTGVAWDTSSTFNVEQGMDVVDVERWLQQHRANASRK